MSHFNYEATKAHFDATLAKVSPNFELYRGYPDVASQLLNAHALGSHWFREVPNTSYDVFTSYMLAKVSSLVAGIDEWEIAGLQYFWKESLKLALRSLTTVDLEQILEALGDDCDTLWQKGLDDNKRHLLHTQKQAKVLAARYQLLMASRSSNDTSSK